MSRCKQSTIKEVAQEAGVSIATVSRVLNEQSGVSEELAEQVRMAVQKLHYQPNAIARALKNAQSRSIGLIIPDIENPFFPALVRGVEDGAQKNGYAVILCNTDGNPQTEERYIRFLLSKQVDGILFVGNLDFEKNASWLAVLPVPMVLLDRRILGAPFSTVLIDNEKGAFLAVEHLIKQGRKRIAIIGGKPQSSTSIERVKGAMDALKIYGYYRETQVIFNGYFSFEGGYQATQELLHSQDTFDAIFAANDMMAIGAMECLVDHDRQVPHDVAVVGFDDIKMASWHKPSLTTVRQPVYEMGQIAVESM
ncbi:MAG: transcriptional regulator, LacI family, partial [Pelosinus sp.]|nr:transcriptional regulator, LacI family [Pelosinus sp.]